MKTLASLSPIALTKNELYDRLTKKIIQQHCKPDSVCIDVGSHNGKILQMMVKAAPNANHYAFEPIESLYKQLQQKFQQKIKLFQLALSNKKGTANFNLVTTNTAYSGLKKRFYDRVEQDKTITVKTDLLDNIIPYKQKIDLIKIDVEGAEFWVLEGSIKTIQSSQPFILFEFGKAALAYNYDDKAIFQFINQTLNYRIYTLKNWLNKGSFLTESQFHDNYETGSEYFFVAVSYNFAKV